jgi:hypothetical protein
MSTPVCSAVLRGLWRLTHLGLRACAAYAAEAENRAHCGPGVPFTVLCAALRRASLGYAEVSDGVEPAIAVGLRARRERALDRGGLA